MMLIVYLKFIHIPYISIFSIHIFPLKVNAYLKKLIINKISIFWHKVLEKFLLSIFKVIIYSATVCIEFSDCLSCFIFCCTLPLIFLMHLVNLLIIFFMGKVVIIFCIFFVLFCFISLKIFSRFLKYNRLEFLHLIELSLIGVKFASILF